ncbi:hypothetical protein OVA29_18710 [Exiguobacterium sp. SL14]|nr:hypothetical protein [Exiguobacterium sp. SL14]MCY1692326.1 hypothetical protein [Exiguobacterium sp. SL14]
METVIQQYGLDTILTEETRAWLRQETFQKGELLCTTGATIDRMYFIVAGKVKISACFVRRKTTDFTIQDTIDGDR